MKAILSDVNIEGHVQALYNVLESTTWRGVWTLFNLPLYTFPDLGLVPETPDVVLWQVCQQQEIILITANRNDDGPDSLESAIRTMNTVHSLPVFTIANARQVLHSREYAERVVEKLLDYLIDIDNFRGTGRLFLP
ncbi:MAG TPA: hypothetical protein VH643_23275 [Gemmataceae bacterium]